MVRNQHGFIILDEAIEIENNLVNKGRKPKTWLLFENEEYLFKTNSSNYEIWSELLASELGKQCKIEMAEYDIGIYKEKYGVISKSFLDKNTETILSGENIVEFIQSILYDNNRRKMNNSIKDIFEVLDVLDRVIRQKYVRKNIKESFIKMWAFDGLIMESDRNPSNWSIIEKNNEFYLSPIYDCSTMARMNNDINDFILKLKCGYDIESLTNNIKYQLLYDNSLSADDFLDSFSLFCEENQELSSKIIKDFNNINVDLAIENVEKKINKNKPGEKIYIPWEVKFWLNKAINTRLNNMNKVFVETKSKQKLLKLFP